MSQRTPVDLKALAQLDGVVLRLVEQQGAQANPCGEDQTGNANGLSAEKSIEITHGAHFTE